MTSRTPNFALKKIPNHKVFANKFQIAIGFLELLYYFIILLFQEMEIGNAA